MLRLGEIHFPQKDFHLGRMHIIIVMLKKWPTMQGMRRGQHLLFQVFVLHHTVVCEFMTALIKHNSLTPSALHPNIRALLSLTSLWEPYTTSPQATPLDAFRSEMIDLDCMHSQKSTFCKNGWVYCATVGSSSVDNNYACHFCRLHLTLWDKQSLIAFASSETLAWYFSCFFSGK